jgi:hypothetical protein
MARATLCLFTGRYAEALPIARDAERIFRTACHGATAEVNYSAAIRYGALEFTGDLTEMTSEAPARARDAKQREDELATRLLVTSMAEAYLVKGAADDALAFLRQHAGQVDRELPLIRHMVAHRTADALLYRGDGAGALSFVQREWRWIERSHFYRGRFMRAMCLFMRARCAAAAYVERPDPSLWALAQADVRRVAKLRCFSGYPAGLQATLAHHARDPDAARRHAGIALQQFERGRLTLSASYARRRLGELTPGAEGARLIAMADAQLSTQVVDPARWVDTHLGALTRRNRHGSNVRTPRPAIEH